jgi:hypothetical protein
VDTIRLAGLIPKNYRIDDEAYLEVLVQKNNLFDVISNFPSIKFIIFCGLEDSELDNRINNIIPKNVIGIHSTHALSDSDLVEALPNGVQRTVNINEMYHPFLERFVDKRKYRVSKLRETFPSKSRLIYVNVNVGTNSKRVEMRDYFKDKRWAKVEKRRLKRIAYLKKVRRYPFILCPQGRAMGDTHREWEALYMGSVPVIEESGYLRKLYAGIPILFVRDFREVNREFLIRRLDLVSALRQMNLEKLDARRIYAQRLMWSIVKESGK